MEILIAVWQGIWGMLSWTAPVLLGLAGIALIYWLIRKIFR